MESHVIRDEGRFSGAGRSHGVLQRMGGFPRHLPDAMGFLQSRLEKTVYVGIGAPSRTLFMGRDIHAYPIGLAFDGARRHCNKRYVLNDTRASPGTVAE